MDWTKLADDSTLEKTSNALKKRGFEVMITNNREEAKRKVLELIPKRAEVMHMTSRTLSDIGIAQHIDESGDFESLKKRILAIEDKSEREAFRKKTLSPDYAIGSVHAITEDGQVLVASGTGSQLPAYVYGANNVIWVVGTQKVVKDLDSAFRRIYEHSLVLESERIRKEYGAPGSSVSKILLFEKERPGRIKLIFIKEALGF